MSTTSNAGGRAAADGLREQPRYRRLRTWNAAMAVLHLAQAVLMVVLAKPVAWTVTVTRLEFDTATGSLAPVSAAWTEVELALLVIGFLLLSALAHALVATVLYGRYVRYLERGMNPYRWYEYAVSASLMIVVVAMLAGIWDLGTLAALFGLVAVMNLCGLLMEQRNEDTSRTDWTPYWVGVVAGAVPWIVVAVSIAASVVASEGTVPDFVLYIYVSIFVFFNLFAINMVLQYREVGPWSSYLYGERAYVLLSLVAKSLLAWQVYFGALTAPV